jgi:hypothetical protein
VAQALIGRAVRALTTDDRDAAVECLSLIADAVARYRPGVSSILRQCAADVRDGRIYMDARGRP